MTGSARVVHGNALDLPIEDNTVDLVVTSPPYFGLRSYQDGGEHYADQIGAEATPVEFLDALIAATAEMARVLKPSGSIWVNLGDKYSGAQAQNFGGASRAGTSAKVWAQTNPKNTGIPAKSLMGIPWRYALRCIDDLGLILRAEVIWSKPNGLPESVTDRVRRSHETWFHFTVEPRYFSAVDEIREPHVYPLDAGRARKGYVGKDSAPAQYGNTAGDASLGKLPGSVWSIPTQPLTVPASLGVDHFAAFPMEWPRRLIRGWCPLGVCVVCGEGRRPVVETPRAADHVKPKTASPAAAARGGVGSSSQLLLSGSALVKFRADNPTQLVGYACGCPATSAPTTPGVVLDPFGGTGTTALVAKALGREGISVDLSQDYCRLARWRTTDPQQLAAAMQVEKPDLVPDGMDSLLDLIEGGAA